MKKLCNGLAGHLAMDQASYNFLLHLMLPKASLRSWPDTQLRPIFVGTKTGSSKHLISY